MGQPNHYRIGFFEPANRSRSETLSLASHSRSGFPRRVLAFPSSVWKLWGILLTLGFGVGSPALAADLTEAEALFKSGKYVECIALTGKEIEEGDFSETWRELRIRAQLELGHYPEALKSYQEAIKRYSESIRLRWLGLSVSRLNGNSEAAAALLSEIGKRIENAPYRYRDSKNTLIVGQYFLKQGTDAKQVLSGIFQKVQQAQPQLPEGFIAAGELALEKQDFGLAATNFERALKLDPKDPAIPFALAKAFASSDAKKSDAYLEAALKLNPRHVSSLLIHVDDHIDAERYNEAAAVLDQVEKINNKHAMAWAYRAVLAHLRHDDKAEAQARTQALSTWKDNPEVDFLIGKKLAQKYRFLEAEAYQRRALMFDPQYLPAQMQLAQNLLRLGKEAEGWKLAEAVFEADPYNVLAHNLATLKDRLNRFTMLMDHGFVVRMETQEAKIYGPRVLALLKNAKETLCKKYDVKLKEPVYVDIYPNQQDFAIRTFGMPGGAGFLGVCFGQVVTMNSPASQGASPSNWEAVLWHEFCHVVTLTKTKNRMPRWLSEGISVYEEREQNPTWGQPLTLKFRKLILEGEATPVSQLSAAFLHAKSGLHLQFAYYESALVVEYLIKNHGPEAVNAILSDLGRGLMINDCLERHAGSLEVLDREFAEFVKSRAENLAPKTDFTDPELPETAGIEELKTYLKEHPNNFPALQKYAKQMMIEKKWKEAETALNKLHELYPAYIGTDSALALLALVYREQGDTKAEETVLSKIAELEDDTVNVYLRLCEIAAAKSDWPRVMRYADQTLEVNPLIESPHRYFSQAAEKLGKPSQAVGSLLALAEMDPIDPAGLRFRIAKLYQKSKQLPKARHQVILSLEEAPRYREAHRLLLEIVEEQNRRKQTDQTKTSPHAPAIAEKLP